MLQGITIIMMAVHHHLIAGNVLLAISAHQTLHKLLIRFKFAQKATIALKALHLLLFARSVTIVLKELTSLFLVHQDIMVLPQDYL